MTTHFNYFRHTFCILLFVLIFQAQGSRAQTAGSLPFIMDMVHNNPGEEPYVTKYNDPDYVRSQGFNGMVTHWFVNCAITYDNYRKGLVPVNTEERKWIETRASAIDKQLADCKKAGMQTYPFTDFIVFPRSVWAKYRDEISGEGKVVGDGGMSGRVAKPDMQSQRMQDMLRAQIEGIFARFPDLAGLTTRFGETYLHDTPYHRGGGPIREGKEGIADQITFINILREEVCVKRNKKIFFRTWDFGYNFHTNPEYYLAVTNKIAAHPNLFFVIKYQQDDFHRMTPFNPTIGIGNQPQVVEAQSRMEAYGKGAHPYYTAKGVIDGWPETKYEIRFGSHDFTGKLNDPAKPRGIKDVLNTGLLKGVLTWSNGGGWDGPYITHEIWTDLNTFVIAQWGRHPERSEEAIFYEFAANLGLQGYQADLFRQLCLLSVEGVRKGQLNSYTSNSVWWSRDQYFSVAENKEVLDEIIRKNVGKQVLAEKAEASAIWRQIELLSKQFHVSDAGTQEAIEVSCAYGRIKYELIEQMWVLMTEQARAKKNGSLDKERVRSAINMYHRLWDEWRHLKSSSKYCASLYTDKAFRNQEAGSIGELVRELSRSID